MQTHPLRSKHKGAGAEAVGAIIHPGVRPPIIIVLNVHHHRHRDLPALRQTLDRRGLTLGCGQGWQEHCCEDGNDRNNNQQLDQRERRIVTITRKAASSEVDIESFHSINQPVLALSI